MRTSFPEEFVFLREMLYEAAYWRENEIPAPEPGATKPEFEKFLFDWGRHGDIAVVAESETKTLVGAAWFRFWSESNHAFGYVSPEVPELVIAVGKGHRGMGVGRQLLTALIREAVNADIAQLSLSVEWDNPALRLYESVGFKIVGYVGNAYTMVIDIR